MKVKEWRTQVNESISVVQADFFTIPIERVQR